MRKSLIIVLVLIVLGVGAWLIVDSNKASAPSYSTSSSNNQNTSANNNTSSKPVATNVVSIVNFAFSPADITVKKGTTVTWTNKDSVAHTVTETDGKTGPASGNLTEGQSYSFKFDTAGTYQYHCTIHPNMTGSVTVTE